MGKFSKIGFFVLLLILVRIFQSSLFYDPFITYFKRFIYSPVLPEFEVFMLILNVLFRYVLNTIISLGLLYAVFERKSMIAFAGVFYSIAFLILIIAFTFLLFQLKENNVMIFFYVRRFLIQPIFILLLIPAFYYQKIMKEQ